MKAVCSALEWGPLRGLCTLSCSRQPFNILLTNHNAGPARVRLQAQGEEGQLPAGGSNDGHASCASVALLWRGV